LAVKYDGVTSPGPVWYRDADMPNSRICNTVEVIGNQSGNLSVSENPFWSFEESNFISQGVNELCLISEKGGWESLEIGNSGISGYRMAPVVEFNQDDGTKKFWNLPINDSYVGIYVSPDDGISLGIQAGEILFSDTYGSPVCPSNNMIPTLDSNSEENFTLASGYPLIVDGDYNSRSILLPEDGWLVNCNTTNSFSRVIISGLDLDIGGSVLNDSGLSFSDLTINSRVENDITLILDVSSNLRDDDSLNISVPNLILANGSADINIDLNDNTDAWRVFWISQESDSLTLHFVSKCPIGGCLN
jgi:hypothetical protein